MPQPAQVWMVVARRSSIIGWACHQDKRQVWLQNLCPRRGWSMPCPHCSHLPPEKVWEVCGVMLLRRHHDLIVSLPTPVICAICPKLAPPSRREMIFRFTFASMALLPSFHPRVLTRPHRPDATRHLRDSGVAASPPRRPDTGGDNPRYDKSAPTHRCWWAGALCHERQWVSGKFAVDDGLHLVVEVAESVSTLSPVSVLTADDRIR